MWLLDNRHPLDGRAYRDRIGRPFYGPALRDLLNGRAPRTPAERDAMRRVIWIAVCVVMIGLVAVAFVVKL